MSISHPYTPTPLQPIKSSIRYLIVRPRVCQRYGKSLPIDQNISQSKFPCWLARVNLETKLESCMRKSNQSKEHFIGSRMGYLFVYCSFGPSWFVVKVCSLNWPLYGQLDVKKSGKSYAINFKGKGYIQDIFYKMKQNCSFYNRYGLY